MENTQEWEKNEITVDEKCSRWPTTSATYDFKAVQRHNPTWKSGAKRMDIFHKSQVENESLR